MNQLQRHGGYGSPEWQGFYLGLAAAVVIGEFLRRVWEVR